MIRHALLLPAVLLFSGCTDQASRTSVPAPPEDTRPRTVLEYLENEAELEKTVTVCLNDPGGIGRSPDCVNARNAKQRLMILGREQAIAGLKPKG